MRTIFLFSFFLIQLTSIAQWPEFNRAHPVSCQWAPFNYYADGAFENVFIIDTFPNYWDGYLAFGKGVLCNPGTTNNYTRIFNAKVNKDGDLIYWTRYDSSNFDLSQSWMNVRTPWTGGMVMNHSKNIISTLTTYDVIMNSDDDRNYIVTLNEIGDITDQILIDSTSADYVFTSIIEDPSDSAYVLSGYYKGVGITNGSSALFKIDSIGNILWTSLYLNSDGGGTNVTKAIDGGFWVVAQTPVLGECSDGWFLDSDVILIKTNELGIEEGRYVFGGQCSGERAEIFEYSEDKIILFGRVTNEENGPNSMFEGYYFSCLIDQSSSNQLVQNSDFKEYLNTYNGHFVDLHKSKGGNYLIVCDNQLSPQQGAGEQWRWQGGILALTPERDSLWFRHYSYYNNFPATTSTYPARHKLLDSKMTSDGGLVCCGYIEQLNSDPNPNLQTPWIFKVDSMGCLEPGCQYVNIEEIVIGLENTVSVFPNPASDIVNLTFTFPENFVPNNQNELVIIDMQGREVLRQSISLFASQNNQIQINISSLSSGVYTLHWISNNAWLDSTKLVVD